MHKRGVGTSSKKYGGGLKEDLVNTVNKFFTGQQYPGEHHAVSLSGPTRGQIHNFTGPGTHIRERLARGDKPINDLDAVSMEHDINYMNSLDQYKNDKDHSKFMRNIHEADKKFIPKAFKSKDEPILGKISSGLMTSKMIGEKTHIIPSTLFSGGKNKNPAHRLYKMALRTVSRSRSRSPRRRTSNRKKSRSTRRSSSSSVSTRSSNSVVSIHHKKRGKSPLKRDTKGRFLKKSRSKSPKKSRSKSPKKIRRKSPKKSRSKSPKKTRSKSIIDEAKDVIASSSDQSGGFGPLASVLIPLVMSAATPLVEKLIRKITGSGRLGGSIKKLSLKNKKKLLLSKLLD